MKTYKVKKGDNLWNIAKSMLGDGGRYPEIVALNNLKNDVIQVGQILLIPSEPVKTPTENHYEKLCKLFETAIQDISELPSVKSLLKELEG